MDIARLLAAVLAATATISPRLAARRVQEKAELRVYLGDPDIAMKYPYVVVLKRLGARFCTGTLITPDWVLTAGHCCENKPTHIQYGKLNIPLNETDSKSEVIRIVIHPRYGYRAGGHNDIALLLVSPGVRMDKYGAVSAVDYSTLVGLSAEYVGGGRSFIKKRNTRHKIRKYFQDQIWPLRIGQGVVSPCVPEMKGYICVTPRCSLKQMPLPGDSGGLVLVDDKIVGITESVPLDGSRDGYFTPVSPYQEWIHSVIT